MLRRTTLGLALGPLLAAGAALAAPPAGDTDGGGGDPLLAAYEAFSAADPTAQETTLRRIETRVEDSRHAGLRRLLELRDRARREVEVAPVRPPAFFTTEEYAPVQAARSFVAEGEPYAEENARLMRPWENWPPYGAIALYDYGANDVAATGWTFGPVARLDDLFNGYPPGADVLVAWLEKTFDFDARLDALADYFDHAYCDRVGGCFAEIRIYDAFASQATMEMPDADAIAFARRILKDKSYRSPIPADRRRQRLYDEMRDGFLKLHRYRTWIRAAADLYVNPDAPLREEHEGLRHRMHFLFFLEDDDVAKIAARLKRCKDRDGFVEEMDRLREADPKRYDRSLEWLVERNGARWEVYNAAVAGLRESGYLRD